MKIKTQDGIFLLSLLLNIIVIPYLAWQLMGFSILYYGNVSHAAELAYGMGYYKALNEDLPTKLKAYSTRMNIIKVEDNYVEVVFGPKYGQFLRLSVSKRSPEYCNVGFGNLTEEDKAKIPNTDGQ
jgi:hypothetical protein